MRVNYFNFKSLEKSIAYQRMGGGEEWHLLHQKTYTEKFAFCNILKVKILPPKTAYTVLSRSFEILSGEFFLFHLQKNGVL